MKKYITLIAIAGTILIIIIIKISLPKSPHTATPYKSPEVIFQTWEEFLESGVHIKYDNTYTIIDD